jgi:mevalonate kinase
MNQTTASAPGKLLLFGEHAVVYGYPCIVTAVNQRIYVQVKKNGKNIFRMDAPCIGLTAYSKTIADLGKKDLPKEVQFVEGLYKRFLDKYPQEEGIDVSTRSEFSCKFGFGSSSAVTVAFAQALTRLYDLKLTKKELFDLCYQAVIDVQGVGSGFDIASAIWGGTIYYVPPAKVVHQVDIDSIPLVVGYTGIKADTPTLIRMVQQQRSVNIEASEAIFKAIERIVNQGEKAIQARNWRLVGELMRRNHELLRTLNVSSVMLEKLTTATMRAGAYGAKLSGAGGGDCMVAVVETINMDKVGHAIQKNGGEVLKVKLSAEGVRDENNL